MKLLKHTLTQQELERKQLELKEKYNFKFDEDNKCYSFEYKNKKAFLINLANKDNHNKITPFFMRRGQLSQIVDAMYENKEGINKLDSFLGSAIEIFGNMLDESKMGSIEGYINFVWEDMKNVPTEKRLLKYLEVFGNIISMIDLAIEDQLRDISPDEMKKIHDKFFEDRMDNVKVMQIDENGEIHPVFAIKEPIEDTPEPEQEYDLRYMTPLNTKEI